MASGNGGSEEAAHGMVEAVGPPSLDDFLPREILVLIVYQLRQKSDVKHLSITSRFFFRLIRSPDLVAAWLWRQHRNAALFMSFEKNDLAVFKQLVEVHHADVNALGDSGNGLLNRASDRGKLEFVTCLLSVPGIQVNLRESNNFGRTALHMACSQGHQAVVHELLQHPAVDVSIVDSQGLSALYWACRKNKPEVVFLELLGHTCIDVNQTFCHSSFTGLHMACGLGHARVVRELLKHPDTRVNQRDDRFAPFPDAGWGVLDYCLFGNVAEKARVATIKELLEHPGLDRSYVKAALPKFRAQGRWKALKILRAFLRQVL